MNIKIVNSVILMVSISIFNLTGCSTITNDESNAVSQTSSPETNDLNNYAEAPPGAFIGGVIGGEMDSSDQARINTALETNPPKKVTTWKNERTGISFLIAPTSKVYSYKAYQICRKYRSVGTMGSKVRHVHGIACRMQDGSWRAIDR